MIVAVRGRSCLASSCKINHFGINPVRGGRPPSESKTRAVVVAKIGLFDHAVVRVLIFVADESFSARNAADVIKMYVPRARSVSCGAYWRTMIIHPIWAIEE